MIFFCLQSGQYVMVMKAYLTYVQKFETAYLQNWTRIFSKNVERINQIMEKLTLPLQVV